MKEKKYKYKAIYAGRRIRGNKVYQLFIRADNKEEMIFTGIRRVYIGCTYKCASTSISTRPERTDDEIINNPQFDAQDELASAFNAGKRAEYKISKMTGASIKAAIEALKPLCKGLDYFSRRTLIERLAEKTQEKTK